MKKENNTMGTLTLSAITLISTILPAPAQATPAKPGKIYVLSGQSNVVAGDDRSETVNYPHLPNSDRTASSSI